MQRRVLLIILIALMMVASITIAIAGPEREKVQENENAGIFENKGLNSPIGDYVADEIIVKFKDGVERSEIDRISVKLGGRFREKSHYSRSERIKIPKDKTVPEMVELYKKEAVVEYAEPNYIAHTMMVPNDQYYKYQWNLKAGGINAEHAWDISTGSEVIVAIIDTGIKKGSDLAYTNFVAGFDIVNNDNDPTDDNGHGTHVAGTVAQSTNNGIGVAGVAYDSRLMAVKVLDRSGSGTYQQVADGINWAANNGANVISMSLGGGAYSTTLCDAVNYAYSKGVTVIAAAGNDGHNTISYPAACNNVISVGATRYDKTLAYYSNHGPNLDLVAPGGDVNVDQNNDGYGDGILQQTFQGSFWAYYFFQGTSMATPHVSGVAALLKSKNSQLTPLQIEDALKKTAVDLGAAGRDDVYGSGLINAEAALNYISVPAIPNNPPVVTTVFSDSFETGILTKWVQDYQNDWYNSNQRATEGTRSAEMDGSARNASITIANPIDLSGRTGATINFDWLIESKLDNGEYLCLDLYNGESWNENRCLKGNIDAENTWHHEEISLSADYLVNGFKLRFRGKMSNSEEDANVDNISVG